MFVNLLKEIESNLKLANGRIVALWGMGHIGRELYRQIIESKASINFECFDKYNENYSEIELLARGKSKYFVIITFVQGYEEAANTLVDMGYEEVRDFICLGKYSKITEEYANGTKQLLDKSQTDLRVMIREDTIETRRMAFDGIDNNCRMEAYKSYFDYVRYRSFELFVREIRDTYSVEEIQKFSCAEAGVFKGDFAWIIANNFPECQIYLYDTFDGFSEQDVKMDLEKSYMTDAYMSRIKKFFADKENTAENRIETVRNKCRNSPNLNFRKGYFPATTEKEKESKWVFVSLDMDLYQPTLEGILFFYPHLVHSGGIFVHDYNNKEFFGVRQAVKDAEKTLGYHIPRMPITDEGGTVVLLK